MGRAREAGSEGTAARGARAVSIHLRTRATLITKDRILSDSARHWLASSSKFHIADKTEVRPSRAGFLDQEGGCGEDGLNREVLLWHVVLRAQARRGLKPLRGRS